MNQSQEFVKAIGEIWDSPIPENALARAVQSFLDYLSVSCAGAKSQEEKLADYFEFAMPEQGSFRVVGTSRDLVLKEAVFLNGLNSHALDFDDGTNSGIIHLGSPVFSVLVPVAQRYTLTVGDLLRAAIIGYEASYTMAISIQPRHKKLGYHATGTCGTLGAVLAATFMLGFTEEERFRAFSAACMASTGMLKVLDEGSELKPYNVAKTSLLALTALQIGKAGFEGPSDPLGGRGFLRMMTGDEDVILRSPLEQGTFAIQKTYTKPYASCRYTHPAVEAAIQLKESVALEKIVEILIRTYDLAVPGHDHTAVPSSSSAKMSIPYSVAVGLIHGKAGLQEFCEDALHDERALRLAEKISVSGDEELSASFPETQTAIVTIRTNDMEVSARVDFPKGEPENPLSDVEFEQRYYDLMQYAEISFEDSSFIFDAAKNMNTSIDSLVTRL